MTNFLKKLTSKSSQVPQISHSLFDEDRPNPENKSFWSKDNLITDNKRLNLSTGCFFNKKSKKKFGEVKSIYLYIYKNFLISSKVPFLCLSETYILYLFRIKNGHQSNTKVLTLLKISSFFRDFQLLLENLLQALLCLIIKNASNCIQRLLMNLINSFINSKKASSKSTLKNSTILKINLALVVMLM